MPSSDSGQFEIEWPARWQREAIEAVLPHLGSDERLRILLDDPKKAIHGTLRVTSSEKVEIAGSRLGGMINLTNTPPRNGQHSWTLFGKSSLDERKLALSAADRPRSGFA